MQTRGLRNKLLLSVLAVSTLVAVSFMIAVASITHQQYLNEANVTLRKTNLLMDDVLEERKANLLKATQQLASQKNLGTTIWYLRQYDQAKVESETLINTYKQLVKNIYQVGRIAKASKVTIYDSLGNLVAFGLFGAKTDIVGFIEGLPNPPYQVVELKNGEEMDDQPLQKKASLDKLEVKWDLPLPTKQNVQFAVVDELLSIESQVPIMDVAYDTTAGTEIIKPFGLVSISQTIDQSFADQIFRLTNDQVIVFTQQDITSENAATHHIPQWENLQSATENQSFSAHFREITINFREITINGELYYQSLKPVFSETAAIGTIAVIHSMKAVQDNTKAMILLLSAITAISLIFIFPLAWYFANSLSQPLIGISRIFRDVAMGKKLGLSAEQLIWLEKQKQRNDELGDLTQSFIAMDTAINQKIDEIKEINASLEQKVKERTQELEYIAHYDALTGIPNRVLLADRLHQAIAQAKREQKMLGVCYLDIDGFKPINDTLGHQAGDLVLAEIALRIGSVLREADTVARLGGDEFVILLPNLNNEHECISTVQRILNTISNPLLLQNRPFCLTASIGVSIFPLDDSDPEVLIRHADQALYIAKESGKNCYRIFTTTPNEQFVHNT